MKYAILLEEDPVAIETALGTRASAQSNSLSSLLLGPGRSPKKCNATPLYWPLGSFLTTLLGPKYAGILQSSFFLFLIPQIFRFSERPCLQKIKMEMERCLSG